MQTVTLNIQDAQYKPVISFLKTLDFVEIENEKVVKKKPKGFEKGNYKVGEKPSDFAGLWQNEKRDLKAIRQKAWKL